MVAAVISLHQSFGALEVFTGVERLNDVGICPAVEKIHPFLAVDFLSQIVQCAAGAEDLDATLAVIDRKLETLIFQGLLQHPKKIANRAILLAFSNLMPLLQGAVPDHFLNDLVNIDTKALFHSLEQIDRKLNVDS